MHMAGVSEDVFKRDSDPYTTNVVWVRDELAHPASVEEKSSYETIRESSSLVHGEMGLNYLAIPDATPEQIRHCRTRARSP